MLIRIGKPIADNRYQRRKRDYLQDVVLWCEHKVLARDCERHIGHVGDLVTVHHSLAGGQEGQGVADGLQVLLNLLLSLMVGNRNLQGSPCLD